MTKWHSLIKESSQNLPYSCPYLAGVFLHLQMRHSFANFTFVPHLCMMVRLLENVSLWLPASVLRKRDWIRTTPAAIGLLNGAHFVKMRKRVLELEYGLTCNTWELKRIINLLPKIAPDERTITDRCYWEKIFIIAPPLFWLVPRTSMRRIFAPVR